MYLLKDLVTFLGTPIGDELFIAISSFMGIFLCLWISSKTLKLEKQDAKTAVRIALIVSIVFFIVRYLNVLFNISDLQKPFLNKISGLIGGIILIILIIKLYKSKWWQTIFMWFIAFFGRFVVMSFLALLIIACFPSIMGGIIEMDQTPIVKEGFSDVYVENLYQCCEKINANNFVVYRSKIQTPTSIKVVNLMLDFAFTERTENVTIGLECKSSGKELFPPLKNIKETNFGTMYEINYEDLNFSIRGYAYLTCDKVYNHKTLMDSHKFSGTKIPYIEGRKPAKAKIDLVFRSKSNLTIDCDLYINTQKPLKSYKKSFILHFIAD